MGNSFAYGTEQQFAAAYPFLQQPAAAAAAEAPAAASEDAGTAAAAAAERAAGSTTAAADRQLLLRFALALMLYQPTAVRGPSNPLAAAHAAAATAAAGGGPQPMEVDTSSAVAAAAALAGVPPGMSRQDVAAVEGKASPTGVCRPLLPLAAQLLMLLASVLAGATHCFLAVSAAVAAAVGSCKPRSRSRGLLPICLSQTPPQARCCCARSWAGSTFRQLLAWTPQRCCRPTWQPLVTQLTRWVAGTSV
jgi:hypothetical protein